MKNIFKQIVFICVCALFFSILSYFFHPRLPPSPFESEKKTVTWNQIQSWRERILWVDARSQEEYGKEHIPGAILLNNNEWDGQIQAFLKAWQPGLRIVVYCSGEECQASQEVASRLRQMELPAVVLKGGWRLWKTHPMKN